MLSILGHLSLIFLFGLSVTLGVLTQAKHFKAARMTAFVILGLGFLPLFILLIGHITSDFSLLNVAENSHTLKPMIYKISGTWGNHEGSMLLFLGILAFYTGLIPIVIPATYIKALIPQSLLLAGIVLFIFFTSDPFILLHPVPHEGLGLNPLLQDIGLTFHPPILYAGYMGLSVPFSLAIAVLLQKSPSRQWSEIMLTMVLIPWGLLTAGIAMGSWWAYRELGWGGYWFWDPVENASLMPWLLATAHIHTLILAKKRQSMTKLSLLLPILAFAMCLLGTFLVRSGLLTSVHSFASSPERGLFILGFITLILAGALFIYVRNIPFIPEQFEARFFSRDVSLIVQASLLICACFTIILATFYPLIYEGLTGNIVAIGAPYFSITFVPIAAFTVFLAGVGPMIAWQQQAALTWLKKSSLCFIASVILTMTIPFIMGSSPQWTTSIFMGCGWWLICASLQLFILKKGKGSGHFYGMVLGHTGIGILLLAATINVAWKSEYFGYISPGGTIQLAQFKVTLKDVRYVPGPNYISETASLDVFQDSQPITRMSAERRYYPVENTSTSEAAIYSTLFYDLYLSLGDNPEPNIHQLHIYYKPAMNLLWFGAFIIALAALFSLAHSQIRYKNDSK